MKSKKILVTCPPMIKLIDNFYNYAQSIGLELFPAEVKQTLSEDQLISLLPNYDGWIIGDDPATYKVLKSGKSGNLKAAVKWGVGTDNLDFEAFKKLEIKISNTPGMFGAEVADIAIGYLIALARDTFWIDREIRKGNWPKPSGISLSKKICGVVGYGNIGINTCKRLKALDMKIIIYDPNISKIDLQDNLEIAEWPNRIGELDFIIINCSLNKSTYHLLNNYAFDKMKNGVRLINVGRGPIVDEEALTLAIQNKKVHSAALDVFENEPLPLESKLRNFEHCIFGSHNSSNTIDSVNRTSFLTCDLISNFLKQ